MVMKLVSVLEHPRLGLASTCAATKAPESRWTVPDCCFLKVCDHCSTPTEYCLDVPHCAPCCHRVISGVYEHNNTTVIPSMSPWRFLSVKITKVQPFDLNWRDGGLPGTGVTPSPPIIRKSSPDVLNCSGCKKQEIQFRRAFQKL
jgi:hypothetical protein